MVSASLDQTVRVWDISGLRKKSVAPGPGGRGGLFNMSNKTSCFVPSLQCLHHIEPLFKNSVLSQDSVPIIHFMSAGLEIQNGERGVRLQTASRPGGIVEN